MKTEVAEVISSSGNIVPFPKQSVISKHDEDAAQIHDPDRKMAVDQIAKNLRFVDRERQRLINERESLFNDPGGGIFSGTPREFVLSEPAKNLWEGIRVDAIDYFERNRIRWWKGVNNEPTGNMLSSQVACVNHLYFLRQRPDLAKVVLQAIDPEVVEAELVDDGYIEFEFIGERQYLKEGTFSRGEYCTSVDAFMIGRTAQRERRAFLVEWKYTETNGRASMYISDRARVYDDLVEQDDSPFNRIKPRDLYFEPFYQMMRQTLLGWEISKNKDHGCLSYRHIHVVPEQNIEFAQNVSAAQLKGDSVSEAWRAVLKRPDFYIATTPAKFMWPVVNQRDTRAPTTYLERRYWRGV